MNDIGKNLGEVKKLREKAVIESQRSKIRSKLDVSAYIIYLTVFKNNNNVQTFRHKISAS